MSAEETSDQLRGTRGYRTDCGRGSSLYTGLDLRKRQGMFTWPRRLRVTKAWRWDGGRRPEEARE